MNVVDPEVRRRDLALDRLRVAATAAILLFHSSAPYLPWPWHFSSASKITSLSLLAVFLLLWTMPLLFVVSGAATAHALATRTTGRFLADRWRRLMVPFIFGVLVIVPPQVYIERLNRGRFDGSFLDFYPRYFDGLYLEIDGRGNFAWIGLHLWYLLFLMLLSVLLLPLLKWLHRSLPQREETTERPAAVAAFLIAPIIANGLIAVFLGRDGLGGWNMLTYPIYFLIGFIMSTRPALMRTAPGMARLAVLPAVAATVLVLVEAAGRGFVGPSPVWAIFAHAAAGWLWVVVVIGAFRARRWSDSSASAYADDMVLPFYILHQTAIVLIAYAVDGLRGSALAKYPIVVVGAALVSAGIYYWAVRGRPTARLLFGLRGSAGSRSALPEISR